MTGKKKKSGNSKNYDSDSTSAARAADRLPVSKVTLHWHRAVVFHWTPSPLHWGRGGAQQGVSGTKTRRQKKKKTIPNHSNQTVTWK